ncbi:MAG: hypothetical protein LKJ86_04355 [Oscillibacter sp.]|nr:hypothetical protein [Oscillibacter sp.]
MMKKIFALLLTAALAVSLTACGGTKTPAATSDASGSGASTSGETGTENAGGTQSDTLPTYSEKISTLPSETEKNPELEQLIIDTWEIPAESQAGTYYYYNYTDLNGDGTDEIFAVAIGPYTSGSGGDSALIAAQIGGNLELNQTLTLVHEPVIISDQITNGCHEIIVPYGGGGAESSYHVLTCSDGNYTNVPDGAAIETLEGVSGTAILYNDLLSDQANGSALTLG